MTLELRRDHFPANLVIARLTVTKGPDVGRQIRWGEGKVVVGTAYSCDLLLSDPAVSRRHCVIQLSPDGAWIRDLKSTNGTRVERHRVRSENLESGSTLRLGRSLLRFETRPLPDDNEARDVLRRLTGDPEPVPQIVPRDDRITPAQCAGRVLHVVRIDVAGQWRYEHPTRVIRRRGEKAA